jgi:(p)ppGpp synthase/HD superfamily hydrolase
VPLVDDVRERRAAVTLSEHEATTPATRALTFAERLHRGQRRKGNDVPYIAHLITVSATVLEHGGDEDVAIAALLYDAVEDQGGADMLCEIETRFGVEPG